MRSVYLFFLFLCFFLLSGYKNVYAGAHRSSPNYSSVQNIEASRLANPVNKNKLYTVIKSNSEREEEDFLIGDEDDDENNMSARKYVLLVKYSLIISYTFVLSRLYSCLKERLYFCTYLFQTSSYRYLIQRALRI